MKTRQQYIDILRSHAADLQTKFGITSLCLFGSVARDEHTADSDIDLFAVMPSKMLNHIAAVEYLENILGCQVDLIQDHQHLRPFFRQQIDHDGIYIIQQAADC